MWKNIKGDQLKEKWRNNSSVGGENDVNQRNMDKDLDGIYHWPYQTEQGT